MTPGPEPQFGERLRRARVAVGLSQAGLEAATGIPKTRISRYENGHTMPSLASLAKLAGALETSEAALLGQRGAFEELLISDLRRRGLSPRSAEEAIRLAEELDILRGGGSASGTPS